MAVGKSLHSSLRPHEEKEIPTILGIQPLAPWGKRLEDVHPHSYTNLAALRLAGEVKGRGRHDVRSARVEGAKRYLQKHLISKVGAVVGGSSDHMNIT